MPPLRRAWLDRVTEAPIDPDVGVVDPHHHLWPEANARYGAYDLDQLLVDTGAGHRVEATVFIDCAAGYRTDGPEHLQPVGETELIAERAARPDSPIAAIVSHASLRRGDAVVEELEAHVAAGHGRFRGIRDSGAVAGDPGLPSSRTAPPPGLYGDPAFVAGARRLAGMGLSFEAWQYHHQLGMVADLADAVPELTIVVNHLGGPLGIGRFADREAEIHAETRRGLEAVARRPNTVVKLGGIGMSRFGGGIADRDHPASSDELVERWGDLIHAAVEAFGPDRAMFESNYPVDGESAGYVVLWNAFKRLAARYEPHERADLLAGTARRVYRLPPSG